MSNLGFGVMINMLGGNKDTVEAMEKSINKQITAIDMDGETLKISFSDGSLSLSDDGQSCCEHRYMVCDDDHQSFIGSILLGAELKDAPDIEDEHSESHEVQFLEIKTDKGSFVCSNHNEHNGYYGGFWIVAKYESL